MAADEQARREWSYTRLETYRACPRRYKLRYVDAAPPAYTPPYDIGRAFHEFAEAYAKHCFQHGLPSDLEAARELALRWRGVSDELEQLCLNWAGRTEFDWSLVVADGQSVERWVERRLPNGDLFRGRIDLVLYNEADQALWIRDYKTSWYADPVQPPDPPLQLLMYAWLAFGQWPLVETAYLQVEYVRTGFVHEWGPVAAPLDWVEAHIMAWIGEINADAEYSPRPGPHCAMCEYLPNCDELQEAWPALRTPEDAARVWRELEGRRQQDRLLRAALRQFVEQHGAVDLGDGRWLSIAPPEYATDGKRPSVPPERLLGFLQAAKRYVDVRELIKLDPKKLAAVVRGHPELEEYVDWVAARHSLVAVCGP